MMVKVILTSLLKSHDYIIENTFRTFDGCGSPSSLNHILNCKKDGFIIQHHNEIRGTIGGLAMLV